MNVLGIETSCDETGVGVYNDADGLVAHEVYTQAGIHERYGGVVPELASRDHVRKTAPLIKQTLDNAGLAFRDLDGIAFTAGPGLVGALLVGATIARSLAFSLGIRAIEINHLEGHLLTPMLAPDPPQMPFLALLVSGGHSMFIDVQGIGHYDVIGESLDDAAGEAFDKTAKLLGLGYPGGPEIERLAAQGDPGRFRFPRPMTNRPGLDLSFSGLKTYTMNTVRAHENDPRAKADIARAFVEAVVDTFVIKCRRAIRATGHTSLVVCGGVSANRQLREALSALSRDEGVRIDFPPLDLCTDNGAMIAYAGYRRLCTGASTPLKYQVHPRWPLTEISAVERPHTPARRTRV